MTFTSAVQLHPSTGAVPGGAEWVDIGRVPLAPGPELDAHTRQLDPVIRGADMLLLRYSCLRS